MTSHDETTINLRLVSAMALKMAAKVDQRALWPGDLEEAIAQMQKWLAEIVR
jgi:hypothetical protein